MGNQLGREEGDQSGQEVGDQFGREVGDQFGREEGDQFGREVGGPVWSRGGGGLVRLGGGGAPVACCSKFSLFIFAAIHTVTTYNCLIYRTPKIAEIVLYHRYYIICALPSNQKVFIIISAYINLVNHSTNP